MPCKPIYAFAAAALLVLAPRAFAAEPIGVNHVGATERLHTSGQPSAESTAPEEALEAMRTVWLPRDQWAEFTAMVLEKHSVDFKLPQP